MRYYKYVDQNGFISLSTLNADGNGNITQDEYNKILALIRGAEEGYAVVETAEGYAYALIPVEPEPDESTVEDKAQAYDILTGVQE